MKRLLITMYRLFFFHRIVYWLLVTAALMIASSFLMPRGLAIPTRFLAVAFVTCFPLLAVIAQFAAIVSNSHLAMVPNGRNFLLGATFCLTLILNFSFSSYLSLLPISGVPEFTDVFLTFFVTYSWLLVVANSKVSAYIIPPVVLVLIFHKPLLVIWQDLPEIRTLLMQSGLALTSIVGWLWLALKLHRTGAIIEGGNRSMRPKRERTLAADVGKIMTDHTRLLGLQTLVYKIPCSRSTRFWIVVTHFLILPGVSSAALWFFIEPAAWGEFIIIVQFYLIALATVTTSEWIATLRVLWLKISGDRTQFWQQWKKLVRAELLLSILMLALYGIAMEMIIDVSNARIALYAVMAILLLPSMCFCAAWFRISGAFDNKRAVWAGIVSLSVIAFLVIAAFGKETYPAVIGLAIGSGSLGLLAYFRVKKGFLTLDWLQVRVGGLA